MSTYVCNKCFYVTEADEAPEKCVVCGMDKTAFTKVLFSKMTYIPDYWHDHLEEKIEKIHENQIKAGPRGASFGFITDIHWAPNRKFSSALLEKVMNECAVPYFYNGGDTVSGAGICSAKTIIRDLVSFSNTFSRLESRMLWAMGNHDPAYYDVKEGTAYYSQNLTHDELYEYMFRYNTKYPDRTMSPDGTYFFADDKHHKVRHIVLNPYDTPNDDTLPDGKAVFNKFTTLGCRQAQLQWFADVALDVPTSDWTVVLCTHTCPSSGEYIRNQEIILGLIKAFREGTTFELATSHEISEYNAHITADFRGRGGEFAVWVTGHTHEDRVKVVDDVLCLSVLSDWNHQHARLPMQRTNGTINEHAFDIFTIDPANHKIYATRIGAGEDREFDYVAKK